MAYGICVEVWGDRALFTRPELSVERVSYDAMTPSAARGLLESIYWHPGMRWIIDRIYVMKPIQFTSVRRNEVKSKISANNILSVYNGANKELGIGNSLLLLPLRCLSKKKRVATSQHAFLCQYLND